MTKRDAIRLTAGRRPRIMGPDGRATEATQLLDPFGTNLVHEMSIAQGLVEAGCEAAAREGPARVLRLHARIGALSGVVREALLFSFDLAAEDTACAGSMLEIEDVPITAYCPSCQAPRPIEHSYHFYCPDCGTATAEILTGRELELVTMEIEPLGDLPDEPDRARGASLADEPDPLDESNGKIETNGASHR